MTNETEKTQADKPLGTKWMEVVINQLLPIDIVVSIVLIPVLIYVYIKYQDTPLLFTNLDDVLALIIGISINIPFLIFTYIFARKKTKAGYYLILIGLAGSMIGSLLSLEFIVTIIAIINFIYFHKRKHLFNQAIPTNKAVINEIAANDTDATLQPNPTPPETVELHPTAKRIVATPIGAIQSPNTPSETPEPVATSNLGQRKKISPVVIVLSVALIAVTVVMGAFIYKSVVQTAQIADLQDTVTSQKERLSLTWEKVDEQSQRANELAREYLELKSHIAIVIEDSRYYHTYDCEQWRSADCYWIYNVEQMSNMSYKPCPYCH